MSKLVNRPENIGEDDEGSPVDNVDEEIGEESDVECDGEEDNETSIDVDSDLDLDLKSSDDDDMVLKPKVMLGLHGPTSCIVLGLVSLLPIKDQN